MLSTVNKIIYVLFVFYLIINLSFVNLSNAYTLTDIEFINNGNKVIENPIMLLKIPKINLYNYIYDKDSIKNNIDMNIQIMKESNMPNENNGNVVLGGHSGSGPVAYFNGLVYLSIGDKIILEYFDKQYIYVVSNIYNDYKDGRITIRRDINDTTVTLFTCNLLNKNNYLVIIGTLISIA